jgi:hypothetical protein
MKNSYQVIAGMHIATDKTYKKGQSVVSDQDLVKMYPGKFRLEGPVKAKKAKAKPAPEPEEDEDETVTETETETLPPTKAKKKKAKVEKADDWDD